MLCCNIFENSYTIEIWESTLGPEHIHVAGGLMNLAINYEMLNNFPRALSVYKRVMKILEKKLGKNHPEVGKNLMNQALLYHKQGDYRKARIFNERALKIKEKALGPDHFLVAQSLQNLAEDYYALGDHPRALELNERALKVREKTLGATHPHLVWNLGNIAILRWCMDGPESAIVHLNRADGILSRLMHSVFDITSEHQKLLFLGAFREANDKHISALLAASHEPDTLKEAFSLILREKGRVLDYLTERRRFATRSSSPDFSDRYERWRQVNEQLAGCYFSADITGDVPSRIRKLTEKKEALEVALCARNREFRDSWEDIDLDTVAAILPEDSILVHYWNHREYRPGIDVRDRWRRKYIAFVLKNTGSDIFMVDLGEADRIDRAVEEFRNRIATMGIDCEEDEAGIREAGNELYRIAFQPFEEPIGASGRLFIISDGTLSSVPFAAFCDEKDEYLVNRYIFNYLDSARQMRKI